MLHSRWETRNPLRKRVARCLHAFGSAAVLITRGEKGMSF